jgi:hypothetical protein
MRESPGNLDRERPTLLEYSSRESPRHSISKLLTGLLCAFFLLGWGSLVLVGGVAFIINAESFGMMLGGVTLLALGGLFVVGGTVQMMGSMTSMWLPDRSFWWDRWFVTISGTRDPRER